MVVSLRAEPADSDSIRAEACAQKLITIGRPEIQPQRADIRLSEPAADMLVGRAGASKGVEHRLADFVAAGTDAGADGRDEIRGIASKLLRHRLNGRRRDARTGAAPAGMNRRCRSAAGICDENRHAVGDLH